MPKTKFTIEKLVIPIHGEEDIIFWFDGNGKITLDNGTFEKPAANSFSLVHKKDCPGATEICKSVCYVNGLEKNEKEVHDKYLHNSRVIKEVLGNPEYRNIAIRFFAKWIRRNCHKGFRWHVSGDIFSIEYAEFIASVCRMSRVFSWIYTRSFEYVEPLHCIANLVVNLSADEENWGQAVKAHDEFGFRICYMTVDGTVPPLPEGSVIFPSYELRGRDLPDPKQAPWWQSLTLEQRRMVCPPDFFGQSEKNRCGPCNKCLTWG